MSATEALSSPRRIAVVTGSRAEYGLLRPIMQSIGARSELELRVLVTGAHLMPPERTIDEIASEFEIAATIQMQSPGQEGRGADAVALGRGITGFAQHWSHDPPEVVLVLGDRIEAFAAAAAAAVAGIRVAHVHGGDRAEGIADEALRHAITKLAHIHFPATPTSAQRIIAMGEDPDRVHVVGSPAIDGLDRIPPMSDSDFASLGSPAIVMLLHPVGDEDAVEHDRAVELLAIARKLGPTLALHPNHDPGRHGIVRAIDESGCRSLSHLPRDKFIGLLRRVRVLVGNSSAGLIEAAAVPVRTVNIGRRQAGRERPAHVVDVPDWDYRTIRTALQHALSAAPLRACDVHHPYGDGSAGRQIAAILANFAPDRYTLRKLNAY